VHVDPIKSTFKAPGTKRLKAEYDKVLSNFAFNLNMRRYIEDEMAKIGAELYAAQAEMSPWEAGAYTRSR